MAYGLGFTRIAIGSTALVAPGFAMRVWLGVDPRVNSVKAMGLAIGARDLALGIGTLSALRGNGSSALWLQCGALADAADAVATLRAFAGTPKDPRILITLAAVGAAGAGAWLAWAENKAG
ncbi:MAG TPA: hypothetical protein VEU28_04820 [Actinomycetota bacterium]|nr:hypothetical protein [Actinomycetota bacterium]